MTEPQAAQLRLDVTKRLSRAMLMVDLLTHRLAAVYQEREGNTAGELTYAIESESADLIALLDEAQTLVLDAANPA